jgi:hypothetical protein
MSIKDEYETIMGTATHTLHADEIEETEPTRVLKECIALQTKKSEDYNSFVKLADYWPHGLQSLHDMMHVKMKRLESLLEASEVGYATPKFESIEDTAKDLAVYASFFVAYARGKMDGQNPNNDIFNQPQLAEPFTITSPTPNGWIFGNTPKNS